MLVHTSFMFLNITQGTRLALSIANCAIGETGFQVVKEKMDPSPNWRNAKTTTT